MEYLRIHGVLVIQDGAESYSFADLMAEPDRTTGWDGVRNFQARNSSRPDPGRRRGACFITPVPIPPCIAGIAEVVRAAHPDPTAFDRKAGHYDPKSDPSNPTWYQVSIKGVRAIDAAARPSFFEHGRRTGWHGAAAQGKPAVGAARDRERMENDSLPGQVKNQAIVTIRVRTSESWTPEFGIWTQERSPCPKSSISRSMPTTRPRSRSFTSDVFGLHVIFESGGDPPAYFLADDHGMAIEVLGGRPGNSGVNQRWVCHLALWVDDVPAKRAELERLGIVFESETLVDNDELKTAFFTDPGGNRSQIVWRKKRLGQSE